MNDYQQSALNVLASFREKGGPVKINRQVDDNGQPKPWNGTDDDRPGISTFAVVVPLQDNASGAQTFVNAAYIAAVDDTGQPIVPPLSTDDTFTDAAGGVWGFDEVQPLAPNMVDIIMYTTKVRAWPTR